MPSAFDPNDYLNVANAIAAGTSSPTEAWMRTAVGRAYYATHLLVREKLDGKNRLKRNRFGVITHDEVINKLIASNISGAGHKLRKLHVQRKRADYDLTPGVSSSDLALALTLATDIVNQLPNVV